MSKKSKQKPEAVEMQDQPTAAMPQQEGMAPNMPQIREIPTWKPNDQFMITGRELEYIYNFITNVTSAFAAVQGIMQRNIMNDKVQVEFDKLQEVEGGFEYVRVEGEESDKLKAEFKGMLDKIRDEVAQTMKNVKVEVADNVEMPEEFTPVHPLAI